MRFILVYFLSFFLTPFSRHLSRPTEFQARALRPRLAARSDDRWMVEVLLTFGADADLKNVHEEDLSSTPGIEQGGKGPPQKPRWLPRFEEIACLIKGL